MQLEIAPVGDRLDLYDELAGGWPEFMTKDPTGGLYYRYFDQFWPAFSLLAVDKETGRAVAKAHAVPFAYDGDPAEGLPEGGWDWVIRQALHDRLDGTKPTMVSALEINIRPDLRGSGLSGLMLTAMRDNAAEHGFTDLVAPVRPSGKHAQIRQPIDAYAYATRDDGLPVDPWLRVHVRAGAKIVNVAHYSMTYAGTLEQWRSWTGLAFDATGPVDVPGALSPIHCDVEQDHAVYVEPNVWVHHRI
ncbi:N-acetyltransferase [Actinoplanes flavus]|uniref:N-acetyltransferase n=1 Tax=Actinoplanes flavus TaxID=2820290 RepID=A0ABS3UD43_9ACTN|nr:N-acetyltransferase [Actinoplanes flavus]MBO3736126.1 N-acetyltransferase [Actinoplanes flavus]